MTEREKELEGLLKESLRKLQYLLDTPQDAVWQSKVTDFMASTYSYLNTGVLGDTIYKHKIKK